MTTLMARLSGGNKELFHSGMLAWLIDPAAPHGHGPEALRRLLDRAGLGERAPGDADFSVATEHVSGKDRFDVYVTWHASDGSLRKLLIENKAKALADASQLERYVGSGADVVLLTLLPETLRAVPDGVRVLSYKDLWEVLSELPLRPTEHHDRQILEYCGYVEDIDRVYDLVRRLAKGEAFGSPQERWDAERARRLGLRDNDYRTLAHFYYQLLAQYICEHRPELRLGSKPYYALGANQHRANQHGEDEYKRAKRDHKATRWVLEKNFQGRPFMETIVYFACSERAPRRLHEPLRRAMGDEGAEADVAIGVRLELDPISFVSKPDQSPGSLLLGSWAESPTLKQALRTLPEYASMKPIGRRNDHEDKLQPA